MSISAVIEDVVVEDGRTYLILGETHHGDPTGVPRLRVIDPPKGLRGLIGVMIWGCDKDIRFGDVRLATRTGYSTIRFVREEPIP